jgi:lipoprotein-anchoring transpeptidase ErfK/SrfK
MALAAVAAAAIAVVVWTASSSSSAAPEPLGLPAPPKPGLLVPPPVRLSRADDVAYSAPVLHEVAARTRPSSTAPVVARLATTTPEETTNIVLVLGRAENARQRLWVHVSLPVLPNNTAGWVPREALGGYSEVDTRLVVDLERYSVTLLKRGRPVFRASVGVGKAEWPTPKGHFYIRSKLSGFGNPFYGPIAFGTSARSAVLTDWPGGGFVGIHGTNQPEILPGRVSHGCIRLRNEDIVALAKLMPVGTPVTIR